MDRDRVARLTAALGTRSIVLVGIMGCGKSSVGRRLAQAIDLPFVDADTEIEAAANQTISEIFAQHGEAYFRAGEQRVIARLLKSGPQVLATGGGAFMNAETREEVRKAGISVWLRAELQVVMQRVRRRGTRPLLQDPDPEGVLRRLLEEREPVYALADLAVWSRDVPHETVMNDIVAALEGHLGLPPAQD
nr:shikimate kinase [Stappia taiwanensis]